MITATEKQQQHLRRTQSMRVSVGRRDFTSRTATSQADTEHESKCGPSDFTSRSATILLVTTTLHTSKKKCTCA